MRALACWAQRRIRGEVLRYGEFAGGSSSIEIQHEPAILNDVLIELWRAYPGLRDRVITEQGQVRTHINIFVGDENIRYLGGLAAPVRPDAVISIIPAVSGGSTSLLDF